MQLYHTLPATDYRWTTSPIDSVKRLRSVRQSSFNQLFLARFELIRLMAFSSVECAIHSAAAAAKFTVAIIQLPLCPVFGGVTSRVAFIDACSHTVLSIKLAMAIICIPVLGFARPEWSISLYQKCSTVNRPKGMIVRAIDRIHTTATAGWASPYRNDVLFGAALAGAVLIGNMISRPWKSGSAVRVVPPVLGVLSTLVLGTAFGMFGLINKQCSKEIRTVGKSGCSQPSHPAEPSIQTSTPHPPALAPKRRGDGPTPMSLPLLTDLSDFPFSSRLALPLVIWNLVSIFFDEATHARAWATSRGAGRFALKNRIWEKLCICALPSDEDPFTDLIRAQSANGDLQQVFWQRLLGRRMLGNEPWIEKTPASHILKHVWHDYNRNIDLPGGRHLMIASNRFTIHDNQGKYVAVNDYAVDEVVYGGASPDGTWIYVYSDSGRFFAAFAPDISELLHPLWLSDEQWNGKLLKIYGEPDRRILIRRKSLKNYDAAVPSFFKDLYLRGLFISKWR